MGEKQILQAVLIAEAFNEAFHPVTQEISKVKLNLVNTPLIDYTLDWLQRSEVDEAIIYCRSQTQADVVKEHCKHITSMTSWSPMSVTVITSEDCDAMGDVLRDLYEKAILKPNFLLLFGDVVSNIDIQEAVQKHRETINKDKTAIMTCVYLPSHDDISTSTNNEDYVTLITTGDDDRILQHQRCHRYARTSILTDNILRYGTVTLHCNQIDPCIAVCSEVVPSLFSDNFDYRSRDNLINGVLEQEELLGYSIYAFFATEGYARRVTSFTAYQLISEDIINRKVYPEVPELSLISHRVRYSYDQLFCNYFEASAKFNKGNIIKGNVIGAGCEVGEGTRLIDTVLGDHCVLHDNIKCDNGYIQSNAVIHSGCVLKKCYIGNGAILYNNVTLGPGCVVGPGVKLGPNITVPPSTRFSATSPLLSDPFRDKTAPIPKVDIKVCGNKGTGYVYNISEEDQDGLHPLVWGEVQDEAMHAYSSQDEEESEDEGGDPLVGDGNGGDGPIRDEDEEREYEFKQEVTDSLVNAFLENSGPEKVVLEINSSRHAYNVTMEHVLCTVIKGVICICQHDNINKGNDKLWPLVKKSLNQFAEVLRNYVKRPRDQIIVLNTIEELSGSETYLSLSQGILHSLNQDLEILDDEVIIQWFNSGGSKSATFTNFSKTIEKMVQWLQEESEEESE